MPRALPAILACVAGIYAVACIDVVLRSRSAYFEGLKRLEPEIGSEARNAFPDEVMTPHAKRYDLKIVYAWFRTASQLFSGPESRWALRARGKSEQARRLWRQELEAKYIPHKDYMLE